MKIKLLDEKCVPFKKHKTDAGWDLKCSSGFTLAVGKVRPVGLGICVEIPINHVGLLFPRSGISTKSGLSLTNSVGVIDSDYRGEVIAQIKNSGDRILRVEEYTRICQLVILPIKLEDIVVVNTLSDTDRNTGGFGSTDKFGNSTDKGLKNEENKQKNEQILTKKEREKRMFEKKDSI